MTVLKSLCLLAFLALIIAPRASAQSGMTSQNGRNFTCASDDFKRHYCYVDTRYGVRMVKQRSGSPCVQGQTWGFDSRGTWVDRGCRADFVLNWPPGYNPGYRPPPPPPGGGGGYYPPPGGGYPPPVNGGTITCSSNNMNYNFCSANTSRGVRLVNQRSGSPCVLGQTWGYNNKGIWVDRGCRADFSVSR